MPPSLDRFSGCLLGLALGDALGAPFEGGMLERLVWRFLGTTAAGEMRWTDDTQMTLDLVDSLVACRALDRDDLAIRFAASYRWSRGYGPGAARLLKRIRTGVPWREANCSVYPEGSFGNGAAMRAPVIGLLCADSPQQLAELSRAAAEVTHAHPQGKEGAVLIATATAALLATRDVQEVVTVLQGVCTLPPFSERLALMRDWLGRDHATPPAEVRARLGTGVAAHASCVTAVYLALRFLDQPLAELLNFTARCGGDVDTVGAMAGALWGAANGAESLPPEALARLEACARIREAAAALWQLAASGIPLGIETPDVS